MPAVNDEQGKLEDLYERAAERGREYDLNQGPWGARIGPALPAAPVTKQDGTPIFVLEAHENGP